VCGVNTLVSVETGMIRVQPSFSDLVVVQRLGGRFSGASRAWLWPATGDNALRLKAKLRAPQTTPEFDALLPGDKPKATAPEVLSAVAPEPVVVAPKPEIAVPRGLRRTPWGHQMAAFRSCLDKFAAGLHGILLAMGMGTGKSLVACMLILWLLERRQEEQNPKPLRVLIVAPLRVIQVWVTQFERHVGVPLVIVALDEDAGSVAEKRDLAAEKMKLAAAMGVPFICVINYDSTWRDPFATWAESLFWDFIIPDEAHRLKTPSGKASIEFKRLRIHAAYRIALTGTPMPHGPMDIYAVFRFLDASIFGPSFSAFRQKYAVMGGYQRKQITGYQNLEELERLMSRITFRVGPEVLDLPPATEVTYYCVLTGEAARIYKDLDEDFVARVQDGTVTAANAMVKLLRLQQVTGGCVPTDDGIANRLDSSKLKLLADTLEDIGQAEPVVVFCRFHADLDGVNKTCEENGYTSMELSGRRDELKRWQAGEAQVLAVQIDAGGEGVDLTRARYSIFYSIGFRLEKYNQAKARTHRPGQNKPVTHIHLAARNTVDVKIMRALEKRADIVDSILAEIKN
jgi:SNF2 family DNA or RNA helicase